MLRLSRRLAVAAMAALAVFGFGSAEAQQPQPIRIGAVLAVTGGAAFLGDPAAKTLRLYVERINRAGGVLGRPLELRLYDSAGDPRQAVTFTRRLIEDDRVDFIIGASTTGETMAMIELVEEARIPLISLAGANVIVEPVKRWVFKTPHSDRMAVEKIYEDMRRNNWTRAAIIAGSGGFDQSCRAEARSLAARFNITIVADETYAPTDTDMTPQLTRIRNATPQGIVGCGFGAPTVITARNFRQLGMTGVQFYFNHGVASQQFIDQSQGAAEGMRMPVAALLVAEQLPANDPQKAVTMEYTQVYRQAYNENVSGFGGHAWDALMIALEAVRRANGTDKARVRDEIEKTTNFVGVDGIFNMTPTDHMGLDQRSFKMVEVRNNTWRLLY
ncbi:MAG: ABC transporter substrate-binding protein [Tagaea sp.]|nr:ABC transporter substrate-binding protein [Tagaea sp.]